MKIMVGIDPHSNNALCGLMEANGRRLLHKPLPCDLAAMLTCKPCQKRVATIAVESTYNWDWLVDGLQDHQTDAITKGFCVHRSTTKTQCGSRVLTSRDFCGVGQ